ncbi:YhfC family intramembrane metalloprotease [Paraburkholderia humisilvae]|uniref:YhfC family intramembrane metalloprotease n=1 Tax=Paraburkholderia humisilvae TaxID=627669 RepID=A0A6J5EV84_9BURK|nr:YhfC family intramembrane metalloprotease [Paraburkholderia humisilvae]CAB3770469.1 hypothetical protein LMG29542_06365 [Paraburkholderia humisilvae]
MPVAPFTLACLIAATLLMAALPFVLYFRVREPLGLNRRPAILGIGVFALFAMLIERALNDFLLRVNPTLAGWLTNPTVFVIVGVLSIGICQEVGRFLAMRWLFKRHRAKESAAAESPRESLALAYGLGHGGAELWFTGVLVQVQWIVFAWLENAGRLGSALSGLSIDTLMRIHLLVVSLTPAAAGVFILERGAALVFQIGLSVLMWRGVRAGSVAVLPLAIAAHALIEVPAALSQTQALPLVVVDTIYVLIAVPIAIGLVRLFRRDAQTMHPVRAD